MDGLLNKGMDEFFFIALFQGQMVQPWELPPPRGVHRVTEIVLQISFLDKRGKPVAVLPVEIRVQIFTGWQMHANSAVIEFRFSVLSVVKDPDNYV